jgi:gliding motility-associated-like protein
VINFDYFVTVTGTPGDIVGDTSPENNLLPGQKIIRSYQNNSDTLLSVYYLITPANDILGCIGKLDSIEVQVHPEPLQDLLISKPLTCDGGSDATLTAILSRGTHPTAVSWRGPSGYRLDYITNDNITQIIDLRGGGYQVIVTDNLGCVNSENAWPVGAILDSYFSVRDKITGYGTTCPGSNDGEIWIRENTSSTGVAPFEFWVVHNEQDTVIHDVLYTKGVFNIYYNLLPGNYKLLLKDANGCYDYSFPEVNIVEPGEIDVTIMKKEYIGGHNVSCLNYSDGSIWIDAITGGNGAPYRYKWYTFDGTITGVDTLNRLDNITAGTYFLTLRDAMNCSKTFSVTLTEPDGMVLTGSELSHSPDGNYNISCFGGSEGFIKLTITGGSGIYTYLWVGPGGFTAITRDISGLRAGTYTCTVTDINGCVLTPQPVYTLTQPALLDISSISSLSTDGSYNISCNGGTGSIDITVTGGSIGTYSYNWSTTDGAGIVSGQEDQNALRAGTYHLIVSDANGCIAERDITLTQPPALEIELIPTHITCQSAGFDNGSINLTVNGGIGPFNYIWSNGAVTQDISGLTEGYYSVTVTDINGCQKTDSIRVNLPPSLTYSKALSDYNGFNISCFGLSNGSIQISPTTGLAPFVYSWQGPEGFTKTTKDISDLKSGRYILLITDNNLCTARDTIDMTEPGRLSMIITPSVSISSDYNINCVGEKTGSVTVEAANNAGLVDYLWADGEIGNIRSGLLAGTYKIIITDSNNCQADSTITLTEPDSIRLTFEISQPFCTDMPNGQILLTVTGGSVTTGYTYAWSDNSTGQNITNAVSGLYGVTVTDQNGCSVKDSVNIHPLNEICLVIPNAISPNGDLINDEWNIGLKDLYPQIEVKIFNRWGELIWKSDKGYPKPWDGRSNGTILPIDSYHYIIDLHNGSKPIIGHVTIVR